MQLISTTTPTHLERGGGERPTPEAYQTPSRRHVDQDGLQEDVNRFELVHLVKRVGQAGGFTPKMADLLEYYAVHTFDHDWRRGERPIVYQSLARTALAMGVSERQIQHLEKRLSEIGALTWRSSGNNKRYGSRDPKTGRIRFAYGVDLSPLAILAAGLRARLAEKLAYEQQWTATKRHVSELRGWIRALLRETPKRGVSALSVRHAEAEYQEIAVQIRTHIKLDALTRLLDRHRALYSRLIVLVDIEPLETKQPAPSLSTAKETTSCSPTSERLFAHYKYTNPIKNKVRRPAAAARQESVVAPTELPCATLRAGSEHVSLRQLVKVSSERFRAHLHHQRDGESWSGFVEAAARLRSELFISQQSWARACETLGRNAAAICVLITDKAQDRIENPVRQPAAYFAAMVNRAREGELRLHSSVYGLLEQGGPCR